MKHQLVDDTAEELAKFLHFNRQLDPQKKREFLSTRLSDCYFCEIVVIIVTVIATTMSVVLSSWHCHCKSSPD